MRVITCKKCHWNLVEVTGQTKATCVCGQLTINLDEGKLIGISYGSAGYLDTEENPNRCPLQ